MSKEIKRILQELYELDPSLKGQEKEIKKALLELIQKQPKIILDKNFIQELRTTIMQESLPSTTPSKAPWFYGLSGGLVTFAFVAIAYVAYTTTETQQSPILSEVSDSLFSMNTTSLEPGAFGELVLSQEAAADLRTAISTQAIGFGGGGGMPGAESSEMKIAPNPVQYSYVYQGEDLDLQDETGEVYLREVNGIQPNQLARALRQEDFGLIDLNSFGNLGLRYLELEEDRDNGLLMNVQFKEEQISFYQNWDRWGRDDTSPLSMNDIPEDQTLLAIAQTFVDDHNIDTQSYGDPFVDRSFEQWLYTDEAGLTHAPETISVWYPLLVNDQAVYESYGGYYGLNIQVNIRYEVVSAVSNIHSQNYLSSEYALETDAARILRVAEGGGNNPVYFRADDIEVREIGLGTPERVYLRQFVYEGSESQEFYVPALRFPVIKTGEEEGYVPESVTIPLVKDFLDDLEVMLPPDIEPLPLPEPIDLPLNPPIEEPIPVESDGGIGETTTSLGS